MRRKSKASSATAAASTGTTRARRTMFGLACLCVLGLAAFLGSSASSAGAAEAFPGQGFLPDNRAWEMVSPPDKAGGNVISESSVTHAAVDGNAVTLASLLGFNTDVKGTFINVDYMAQRLGQPGTSGWSTHSITPKLPPGNPLSLLTQNTSLFYAEFTPDLSHAVYKSWRPLTEAPNSAPVSNLYVRGDLRQPDGASNQLLSDAYAPLPSLLEPFLGPSISPFIYLTLYPTPVGASTDLSHVIFESKLPLSEDAQFTFAPNLYESTGGVPRLVGRVPADPATFCDDAEGPACEAAPSSQVGLGGLSTRYYNERVISRDGSRVFFQAPAAFAGGKIYLREDGSRTYQLNASEKETAESPQIAQFKDASSDGSRAFFMTSEGLVEGDDDGKPDLYMYEVEKPEGKRLTLLSVDNEPSDTGPVTAVVGASADGHSIYFTTELDQLVAGEPTLFGFGLYHWHDGQISYLGYFSTAGVVGGSNGLNGPEVSWNGPANSARLTPDGRHMLFMTQNSEGFTGRGGFAGYDQANRKELFLYSADSGKLECASCNPTGASATADALNNIFTTEGAAEAHRTPHLSHALSKDGRYVFFSTAEALVPGDSNGTWDAYVYDSQSGKPRLLSSGEDKEPSYFMDASDDGRDVFISTAEPLSGWDVDRSYDLYDARVGGGFAEPQPEPPACQGDACQPLPTQLNDPTPASSSFTGPGDPNKAHRKKRHARKHHKRKRHQRAAKQHRREAKRDAKNDRRASR